MADCWTYTNAEHTEARKGRFGALLVDGEWAVYHDDFPRYYYTPNNTLTKPRTKTKPYYELRVAWYEVVREFLAWHAAQPAPIAVGDYVRLTGERWGEHMGKVVRVVRAESETEYAAVKIDGSVWYITPDWTSERITVTADLDDPWNLPMPEVGEYVWMRTRGDGFRHGRVTELKIVRGIVHVMTDAPIVEFGWYSADPASEGLFQITAWGTYDPADLTPDEPTTFGYVGYVTDADGDVWDVSRYGIVLDPYQLCNRKTGKPGSGDWPDVLALGTFTVVERD